MAVRNPDGGEGRLAGAFAVIAACGAGAAEAAAALGLAMGLLSLAGADGLRRRRKAV